MKRWDCFPAVFQDALDAQKVADPELLQERIQMFLTDMFFVLQ